MSIEPKPPLPTIIPRRYMLQGTIGLAGLALTDMLAGPAVAQVRPTDAAPHGFPHTKRVIFLFMHGGPSHVDTFDYKPELIRQDGKPLPFDKPRVQFAKTGNLLRSPWEFKQYGQCGAWVSDLFPHVGRHADDLCFIKSMHGSNEAHGGAMLKMHTGSDTFVRPSMGSWISYGLGTENANLPSFITINPTLGHGGVRNFGSAFLPPIHQATRLGSSGKQIADTRIENLRSPEGVDAAMQTRQLSFLQQLAADRAHQQGLPVDNALQARLESFELAFRMQQEAPALMDLADETQATRKLYGIDEQPTDNYGRECLLARRFSEAGVRFVQASHAYWDQHSELKEKHTEL